MKTFFTRMIGLMLIAGAIGGLVISGLGLWGVWYFKPAFTDSLLGSVRLGRETLRSTANGLELTQQSLQEASASMQAVQNTLETTVKTFQDSQPMLDSVVRLLGKSLPDTVMATQNSLNVARQSAQLVDTILEAVSFFPGIEYNPEVPLNEAIGQIAASLTDLPATFIEMQKGMKDARGNIEIIQADLAVVTGEISQIETSLDEYQTTISSFQDTLKEVQRRLGQAEAGLPGLVNGVAWGLTVFLIWMAIAQLGLLSQGWELVSRDRKSAPVERSKETDQAEKTD